MFSEASDGAMIRSLDNGVAVCAGYQELIILGKVRLAARECVVSRQRARDRDRALRTWRGVPVTASQEGGLILFLAAALGRGWRLAVQLDWLSSNIGPL